MSDVPLTLEELKIVIGKDMLFGALDMLGQYNELTRRLVYIEPPSHHIAAAENWRNANRDEMKVVGVVVSRALAALPGGLDKTMISIMSDLSNDTDGIHGILRTKARSIAYTLGLLPHQSVDDIEKCLEAIVAFCNGE